MSTETLHFENPREVRDISGERHGMRERIGEALEVKLTARDLWLKIEGEDEAVRRAIRFFDGVRHVREEGVSISRQGLDYALSAFCSGREDVFARLSKIRVDVSPRMPSIFPRTLGQQVYLEQIYRSAVTFSIGPAGTGKTYLAMAVAVSELLQGNVNRIILTRPAIEAGETLGFLPGDLQEKVDPYLRPLYDALYDMLSADEVERYRSKGVIEVAPLAYMRGRTLNHAFTILDEAQNTTMEQMFMFLTRLGFDSRCVVTGDATQTDLPPNKPSGLLEARRLLAHLDRIGFCDLTEEDVVRHPIVQEIIRAYRKRNAEQETES
ncbi:PhoH family protein [Kiritimatiella glycovorans]|uniref:PhoH-like protein n=1 Tax=Kiritimatiella glycovorans TaxID=1307763 RepID=A0A0G3EHA8_9BACT|nr:PhoH family protein [Kiritimatiella glycovorans]AKJ64215.1 PhoH-like protein [Kiritimatiella glycovorans]